MRSTNDFENVNISKKWDSDLKREGHQSCLTKANKDNLRTVSLCITAIRFFYPRRKNLMILCKSRYGIILSYDVLWNVLFVSLLFKVSLENISLIKNTINDDGESLEIIVICWAPQPLSIWDSLSCHLLRYGPRFFVVSAERLRLYISIWQKSDLYLRCRRKDLITPHYWSCSVLKILTNELVTFYSIVWYFECFDLWIISEKTRKRNNKTTCIIFKILNFFWNMLFYWSKSLRNMQIQSSYKVHLDTFSNWELSDHHVIAEIEVWMLKLPQGSENIYSNPRYLS